MKVINFGVLAVPVALLITSLPTMAQSQQMYTTYECDTGKSFQVQYGTNSATLKVNNQSVTLPAVQASAGRARYSDRNSGYVLDTNASKTEAFLELNGDRTHEGCIAQTSGRSSTSGTSTHTSGTSTHTTSTPATPVRGLW